MGFDRSCGDSLVEAIVEKHRDRARQGRRRFGGTMRENKMPTRRLIQEAIEEALDLAVYLQFALEKIELAEPTAKTNGLSGSFGVRAKKIVEVVGDYFAVSPEAIMGPRRHRKTSQARAVAMFLMREKTRWTLAEIARYFERDHTSVVYAVRKVEERCEWTDLKEDIVAVRQQLEMQ